MLWLVALSTGNTYQFALLFFSTVPCVVLDVSGSENTVKGSTGVKLEAWSTWSTWPELSMEIRPTRPRLADWPGRRTGDASHLACPGATVVDAGCGA